MLSASTLAREQAAYLRSEPRSEELERAMSVADVERVMEAFVAVEAREGADGKPIEHRVKVVEGLLCVRDVSERELRWVFGYDEGPVLFVGFVVVFTRDDAGDDWTVRQIDRQPDDECPVMGEG
jgi:hypothetical protein